MGCPYCLISVDVASRDHIFPQFIGGSRTIAACKDCNDRFGHTVEAAAASQLQPLHVFISSWGVPLANKSPLWPEAYTAGDKVYDLLVGEKGVKPRLSRPVIKRDSEGQIVSGEFASRADAERAIERLAARGKLKRAELHEVPPPITDLRGLENTFELGPAVRRLALKMCIALGTLVSGIEMSELDEGRQVLLADPGSVPSCTLAAYGDYPGIDNRRPALSHVVYVERGSERVYGLVQFFGVVQLFCRLGKTAQPSSPSALLATLDPVAGAEEVAELGPLSLPEPPYRIHLDEYPRLVENWTRKFREEAIRRGATHPPNLQTLSIEVSVGEAKWVLVHKPKEEE